MATSRATCTRTHPTNVTPGKTYSWTWRHEAEHVTIVKVMDDYADDAPCYAVLVDGDKSGTFLTDLCCIGAEVTPAGV